MVTFIHESSLKYVLKMCINLYKSYLSKVDFLKMGVGEEVGRGKDETRWAMGS